MKIAVTGATGFVGRHLVNHLLSGGHQVRAWFRTTPPEIKEVQWIRGELNAESEAERNRAVDELLQDADACVHTALSRRNASFMAEPEDPCEYFETNVIGSLRLLEAAANSSSCRRFVFVSSGAVHQQVEPDLPLNENHPLRPASLYGAAKASVETVIHAYGLSGKLDTATVRPPSIIGRDSPLSRSKWFALIAAVARGEPVEARGGGKVVTVDDLCRAIYWLLERQESIAGQTFNCVTGYYSEHQIATWAAEVTAGHSEIAGLPKSPGTTMSTEKIQNFGFEFSNESQVRALVHELTRAVIAS